MFDVPDLLPCPALTLCYQLSDDDVDNGDDVGNDDDDVGDENDVDRDDDIDNDDDVGDEDDASSSPPSLKPATGGYMFPSAISTRTAQ